MTEDRKGNLTEEFEGNAYQPAGKTMPQNSNNVRTILSDIRWNIDYSAQWIRKFCSRKNGGAHGVDDLVNPSGRFALLREDGDRWDLDDPELIKAIQSTYQQGGNWDTGVSFGDPPGALRQVREAWGEEKK